MASIYVGNLPFSMTEDDLQELFSEYGEVTSTKLINDHETGRPRGFGFVEIDADGAKKAIESLDGQEVGGRTLRVNEARQRAPHSRGR